MAQTDDEPIAIEIRQTGRPERHQFLLLGQHTAVQGHRIPHQGKPMLVHAVNESGQVQPAEYARGQREDGGLIVHLLLGVTPVALLFRQDRQSGAGGDRGVNQRITPSGWRRRRSSSQSK